MAKNNYISYLRKFVLISFLLSISYASFSQCQTPTASDVSRCGEGTVVLNASGNTGPYSWYDASSDGIFYSNDAIFTTPFLNSTDTFYVGGNSTGTTNDAISFDGTNDYVAIQGKNYATAGEITQITIEAWIKTSYSSATWNNNWSIVDFDRSEYYNVYINATTGTVSFSTTDNSSNIQDFSRKQ